MDEAAEKKKEAETKAYARVAWDIPHFNGNTSAELQSFAGTCCTKYQKHIAVRAAYFIQETAKRIKGVAEAVYVAAGIAGEVTTTPLRENGFPIPQPLTLDEPKDTTPATAFDLATMLIMCRDLREPSEIDAAAKALIVKYGNEAVKSAQFVLFLVYNTRIVTDAVIATSKNEAFLCKDSPFDDNPQPWPNFHRAFDVVCTLNPHLNTPLSQWVKSIFEGRREGK